MEVGKGWMRRDDVAHGSPRQLLHVPTSNFQLPTSSFQRLPSSVPPHRTSGFTLAEVVLGGTVLAVAVAAILGAYVGQVTLNEHARNLSLAIQDANRVIEQIRQNNATCLTPNVVPAGFATWNAWLEGSGGPKSIQPNTAELIAVTCQEKDGGTTPDKYCNGTQVGPAEWEGAGTAGTLNLLRVTVAVCWRHRGRIIGECTPLGAALQAADGGNGPNTIFGVIESPAMLTTLVTCRG